ncbi:MULTISPECIES: PEP-CTERM sorting domain-containing protein [Colwellia]|nr:MULTISPECIES: PEP-CTERM sorting domain-containing protein [Colwellia]
MIKRALAIAVMVLTSFSASAGLINVGGVVWDPDHVDDFYGGAGVIYQELDLITKEISGFGRVTTLNGRDSEIMGLSPTDLCPGCELTFHFGGYTISDVDDVGNIIDAENEYEGGWMKFWVDFTPDASDATASLLTFANTGDDGGTNALWLSLVGHIMEDTETTFKGILGSVALTGQGALDVVGGGLGGLAAGNIDTTLMPNSPLALPNGTMTDITFTSGFTKFPTTQPIPGQLVAYGTANFSGSSIPEPGTLAVFALGLIALAIRVGNKRV